MVPETLTDIYREKTDDDLLAAAASLAAFTGETEQVIRAELRRRGLPEPPAIVRTESHPKVSFFSFAGRAGRLEFFWSWLVINVFAAVLSFFIPFLAAGLMALVLLVLPTVRRLNDLRTSRALSFLLFVPGVNVLFFLILLFKR